jgi:hypothetical protein
MTDVDGYPYHLAGEDADRPAPVSRRTFEMALRAAARMHHGADPLAVDQLDAEAINWRPAGAIVELFAEANAADPTRNKASDGTIGDARHAADPSSDHNPSVIVAGVGVVRAGDVTNDPAMHLVDAAERIRAAAAAGRLPQATAGGYVILNSRITKPDFSGWSKYTGTDPHVSHMHVSVSRDVKRFDSRASWNVFGDPPAPAPAPAEWSGPDLAGVGPKLRGQAAGQPQGPQSNGPRVAALQGFLRRYAPAYAGGLEVDGWYGPQTAGVLREFAARSNVAGADGLNIGPKLALALWRAGFER